MLNKDQERVYNAIINSNPESKHCIIGNAGTGKTYLTSRIVQHFIKHCPEESIAVIAPTHQAVKVAKQSIGIPESLVHYCTVASMLGQFGFRNDEGLNSFSRPKMSKKANRFTTVIGDEVSQLNKKQEEILNSLKCRVIFVGDDAQLKAVMSKSTDLFETCENVYKLTQQMRNEGSIEKIANKCRKKFYFPQKSEDNVFVHEECGELINNFLSTLEDQVNKGNLFSVVYLAYRNEKVDQISSKICKHKFPYLRLECNDTILGKRGDTVKIVKWLGKDNITSGIKHDTVLCQTLDGGTEAILNIINNESLLVVENNIKQLSRQIKSAKSNNTDCTALISELDTMYSMFTPVSSPFVITVHKSQGISKEYVFVDTKDINSSNCKTRLLYVAYSRAKKQLHLTKVK